MNQPQQPYSPPPQQPLPPQPEESDGLGFFTTPLSKRGWPRWTVYLASVLGTVYLLNPTLGLFEFLPDTLPLIGNMDEAGALLLMWYGLVEFIKRRKP